MSAVSGGIAERMVMVRGVRLATAVNTIARDAVRHTPLLVLPAAQFVWRDYRAILDHFASERRVAALDWPGFGSSDRLPAANFAYSARGFAELLEDWLNAVGGTRVVLLGNGIGGEAALRFALAHPERIAGLALVAPWGFHAAGLSSALRARLLGVPWLLRMIAPLVSTLALGPANAATRQIVAAHRAVSDPAGERAAAASMLWRASATLDTPPLAVAVRNITAPTIVLRGALDPVVSAADARRATSAIGPHGALEVVLPESGHLPFLQQPGPFLRAIRGLFETIEAGETH